MADIPPLPAGFTLDQGASSTPTLPPGFTLDGQANAPAQVPSEWSPGSLASSVVRPIAKGIAALPLMAMDAGVASRNLIGNAINSSTGRPATPNYTLPSTMFNQSLDSVTRAPTSLLGKLAETGSSMVVGAAMPGPTGIKNQAPENFVKPPDTPKEAVFAKARDEGLVVPPASVKPTIGNRLGETLGGKIATEQDASVANAPKFVALAKRAIGIPEDKPLTAESINDVRKAAGAAYDAVRGAGTIEGNTSPQFAADLAKVTAKYRGAAVDFPELAKTDVADVVASVDKPSFDANSAVDAISILRDKASAAYASGDKTLGAAYRDVSRALENSIEATLAKQGKDSVGTLQQFRQARELIAKTYSVQKAFNETTGQISAAKLASDLAKEKPLTGDLKTIAEFGRTFPKAAKQIVDSGSVRNTDLIVGGVTGALSKHPAYLGYPLLRMGARSTLLSTPVQNSLMSGVGSGINPAYVNALVPLSQSGR